MPDMLSHAEGLQVIYENILDIFQNSSAPSLAALCLGPRFAFRRQHCMAAAISPAQASIVTLDGGGMTLLDNQPVIIIQFFPAQDIAQGVNKNLAIFFPCLAIGRAAMIDPA